MGVGSWGINTSITNAANAASMARSRNLNSQRSSHSNSGSSRSIVDNPSNRERRERVLRDRDREKEFFEMKEHQRKMNLFWTKVAQERLQENQKIMDFMTGKKPVRVVPIKKISLWQKFLNLFK